MKLIVLTVNAYPEPSALNRKMVALAPTLVDEIRLFAGSAYQGNIQLGAMFDLGCSRAFGFQLCRKQTECAAGPTFSDRQLQACTPTLRTVLISASNCNTSASSTTTRERSQRRRELPLHSTSQSTKSNPLVPKAIGRWASKSPSTMAKSSNTSCELMLSKFRIQHKKGISEGISQPSNDTGPHVRPSRNLLLNCQLEKIGTTGFEPATSAPPVQRSTKLSHVP